MSRLFFILFFALLFSQSFGQTKNHWVDSVLHILNNEEKIGQLMIGLMSSSSSADEIKNLASQVKSNKIGGLLITHGSPVRSSKLINQIQSQAKPPLLILAGFTNNLSEIFDSTMSFYDPMAIDAVTSDSLKRMVSSEIAHEMKSLGIHFNLSQLQKDSGELKFFDMRGLAINPKLKKGEAAKQVFLSRDDLLLIDPREIDAAIKSILKIVKKDKVLSARLDQSVSKILALKYDAGLAQRKFIDTDNLNQRLHSPEAQLLKQQIAEASVTVVQNQQDLIPIQKLDNRTFASVSIGAPVGNEFDRYLSRYVGFEHFSIRNLKDTTGLETKLKDKDIIVIGLFPAYGSITKDIAELLKKISSQHQVVVCSFDLNGLENLETIPSLIAAYSDEAGIPQAAAQIIFGAIAARGKLPMKISDSIPSGTGLSTATINRFTFNLPEAAEMDSKTLERIEPIALEAINTGATPGCRVLVARNGKVVYDRSFGWLAYDKKILVGDETIYDLASVTKVSATLQTVMYMQEKGMIDVNKKVSVYLPELKKTNKEDLIIKDILTHQAGLWPYLPFWSETVKDTSVSKKYYSTTSSEEFPYPVAENMFAAKSMKDSLWHWIIKAKIRDKAPRTGYDYRYSDMGFYIMQHLAEKMLGESIEDFLQKNIYRPLGASSLGYLPLRKFPASQIAPTEKDTLFRKSLLTGYVHDQGAAMHGGVAGHAGLFSNAYDLAKLGQMWLDKGSYGGVSFFKPETLEFFTAKQYENSRRGLGWDKPILSDWNSPTSMYASAATFGHTGFTGTCIWVDPEFNLVYVFLSNRVNPDMNNTKLLNENIRPRIQDLIYKSIFEYSTK